MNALNDEWKVWELNDYEWWLAPTKLQAMAAALNNYGHVVSENPTLEEIQGLLAESFIAEFEIDSVRALTVEELDSQTFVDDLNGVEPVRRSFREELELRIKAGPKVEMFATTEI